MFVYASYDSDATYIWSNGFHFQPEDLKETKRILTSDFSTCFLRQITAIWRSACYYGIAWWSYLLRFLIFY